MGFGGEAKRCGGRQRRLVGSLASGCGVEIKNVGSFDEKERRAVTLTT
jgi:hypothetical protein